MENKTYTPRYSFKKNLLAWLACGLICLALAGCNTIQGAGEDLEEAGDEIEDAAEDAAY